MRRVVVVCVAISLGGFGGWWSASNRIAFVERHVLAPADDVLRSPELNIVAPADFEEVVSSAQTPSAESPKIEFVNGSEHQFGTMERFGRKRHVFIIRNTGKGPLVLTPRGTTCKCTVFQVDPPKVAPGEQTRVTLEWVAETQEEETNFRQEATVETNVPGQTFVKLIIDGKVTSSLKAVPTSVSLGDVAVGAGAQATVQLFAFRQPGLEVSQVDFADQESASYFDIKIDPLAQDAIKAQAADHGLAVRIVVKPGLPLGKLSQQILLEMPLGDKPVFQIPVNGTVVGDIAVLGPKQFDSDQNRDITWRHLLQQTSEWEGTLFGLSDRVDRNRDVSNAADNSRKGQHRVGDCAGEHASCIQAGAEWDDTVERPAPEARLNPDIAGETRRHTH